MKILVINGPNINMLGIREKDIYGKNSYNDLIKKVQSFAKENNLDVNFFQSNYEGAIVEEIQSALGRYDGIIINPAAYTHTSIAILDALKAVNIETVEVHLSDIDKRESFRKKSYVSLFATKIIKGHGFDGYIEALKYFLNKGF